MSKIFIMQVTIRTEIINGNIKRNRREFIDALKQFESKEVDITIGKAKKKRSNPENRYYWGVVIPLIKSGLKDITGETYTNQQVHEVLKHRFLKEDIHLNDGEFLERVKSTSELSTFEMEEYLELCRTFAQEFLGVTIALPNESIEFEF